jgi:hypothetical protein
MSSLESQAAPSQDEALLHELLDYNMIQHRDSPMYTFAFPGHSKITEITYLEFGKAAHRVARFVRPDPSAGNDNEVVGILANIGTLAYQAIVAGVMRSGLTVSCLSFCIMTFH